MARARNIKPGFFKNEILGVADPIYSLLFEGLWVLADREGRLEDRPLRIKGELFPYREGIDIEALLDWLQAKEFIVRYVAANKRYIQVVNFLKHQNPHKNETESEIPSPENIGTASEKIGSARACSLIPDSLIPDSSSVGASAPIREYPDEFERTWCEFPRRAGDNPKKDAYRSWNARLKDGTTAQEMHDGTCRYRQFCEATGKLGTEFVMQAKRFFGQSKAFAQPWETPSGGSHETHQRVDNSAPARVRRANERRERERQEAEKVIDAERAH